VADRAEIASGHQQDRQLERRHPVEHGVAIVQRHHDAPNALYEKCVLGRDAVAAEAQQFFEIDREVFPAGGHVG
jgi:hypothetical protein